MLNDGESYTFEDKTYVSPTVSRDEQLEFIENLRATQEQGNQDIRTQTRNLGTDIPLNQGGLTGADSYFTQRYQTPQTEAIVSQLRTTAQASALNDVLSNLQKQYQEKYNQAYRSAQKRKASSGSGGGSGSGTGEADKSVTGNVNETSTGDGGITVSNEDISITTAPNPEWGSDTSYYDISTGEWVTVYDNGVEYRNGKRVKGPNTGTSGAGSSGGGGGGGGGNFDGSNLTGGW